MKLDGYGILASKKRFSESKDGILEAFKSGVGKLDIAFYGGDRGEAVFKAHEPKWDEHKVDRGQIAEKEGRKEGGRLLARMARRRGKY